MPSKRVRWRINGLNSLSRTRRSKWQRRKPSPESMVEAWIHNMHDPAYQGRKDFNDREMAISLLSFLFASQDANEQRVGCIHSTTSSIIPRSSQKCERSNYGCAGDDLQRPAYTRNIGRDDVPARIRKGESSCEAPRRSRAIRVATKTWKINDEYTIPKGALLGPSIYPSCHDPTVYPEPDKINPERWSDPSLALEHLHS